MAWLNPVDTLATATTPNISLDVVALAKEPWRIILKLALPTMGAMLLQSVVNEIDLLFFRELGPHAGTVGQAALIPSVILVWLFGGTLSAIGVGTQAFTARRIADGKPEEAGAVLSNALVFCVLSGVLFTGIAALSLKSLLHAFKLSGEVFDVAYAYSSFRVFGVISMVTTIGAKAFFDGIGKTYVHFWASLVMNVFNVLFCWMFIFGHFGAPAMGAPGAGLGALLSTWIGLAIVLAWVWRDRVQYQFFRWSNVSWPLLREMLKLSAPAGVATLVMMPGFAYFTSLAQELDRLGAGNGVNGAATANIIGIMKLTFTACIAFGVAAATLVGQSVGAHRNDLAKRYGWSAARLGFVFFGVIGILECVVFNKALCRFMTHDVAVQELMSKPLMVMGFATPLVAVALILTEALFGAGRAVVVAITQVVLIVGVLMFGGHYLASTQGLGVFGMWMAAGIYSVMASLVLITAFAKMKPKVL